MEILVNTLALIMLLGLFAIPILLYIKIKKWNKPKLEFIAYLGIALFITAILSILLGWWANYSDMLLMGHYGYNFDAWNDGPRFEKVASENMKKVKMLENRMFGIGWPLQVIMCYVFYVPYLVIVYLVGRLIAKLKSKKQHLSHG